MHVQVCAICRVFRKDWLLIVIDCLLASEIFEENIQSYVEFSDNIGIIHNSIACLAFLSHSLEVGTGSFRSEKRRQTLRLWVAGEFYGFLFVKSLNIHNL